MRIVDIAILFYFSIHTLANSLNNNHLQVKTFLQDDQKKKEGSKNDNSGKGKEEDENEEEEDNTKYLDYESLDALM